MNENDTDNIESTNDETVEEVIEDEPAEEVEEETQEDEPEEDPKDKQIEELQKKIKTLQVQRAKAKEKTEKPKEQKEDLTLSDFYALNKANVEEEDVSDIVKYARLENITISEALKSPVVKAILKDKTEQRKVANATNTGSTHTTKSKSTDEEILKNASKGVFPDNDDDIARLAELKVKSRK